MEQLEQFREEVRAWLEENCPATMRTPMGGDEDVCWGGRKIVYQSDEQRLWLERMAQKGWTVPQWAQEYGGAGFEALRASARKFLEYGDEGRGEPLPGQS